MSVPRTVYNATTFVGLLVKAAAYGARAATTRRAVERMRSRYQDRADSARYLSEAMTKLEVDEPTTTAYMEVATLSQSAADHVGAIVSEADVLSALAEQLSEANTAQHGRMADANRTHDVQMADRSFIKRT
ncbi:hypothetical protein KQH21_31155 [Streptomyces sp. IpFD-1.1]|uniref:hypothetical protein n=1 Tax=unclassified Streptomyces TaxID=2593676 RepID=UPI001436A27D|nr:MULTISPECIES: hypothetical protein [unclassified Streptomyces]MBV7255107.1 hypothetical protein [Streptomyces sp. S-2]MCO6752575.1 hypothetical protein [Streptomyces sp. IpFD-1.1]